MHDRDVYRRAAQEYERKAVGPGGQDADIVFVSKYFLACSQLLTLHCSPIISMCREVAMEEVSLRLEARE